MNAPDYSTQGDAFREISRVTIFAGIGLQEQHLLVNHLVTVKSQADEIIIEEGEVADRLYIIVRGQVHISVKNKNRGWVQVATLGQGDVFGEIAIVRSISRTARVTTVSPCTFHSIDSKNFLEIYQYFTPKSRDNIQSFIAKRLDQIAHWRTY